MSSKTANSSGMRGGEKAKKGPVSGISIDVAANGYVVRVRHQYIGGDGCYPCGLDDDNKERVFEKSNKDAMTEFVMNALDGAKAGK